MIIVIKTIPFNIFIIDFAYSFDDSMIEYYMF